MATKTGTVHVIANRVAGIYQDFSVTQEDDGSVYYYHADLGRWVECPQAWLPLIRWN